MSISMRRLLLCSLMFVAPMTANAPSTLSAKEDGKALHSETSIQSSIRGNRVAEVREALEAGANANQSFTNGHTAVSLAAMNGQTEMLRLLIDFGADIESGRGSATPLAYAAARGRVGCVSVLLAAGADPESVSSSGKTPLHFAALKGHEQAVQVLLDHHVKTDVKDKAGATPIVLAERAKHIRVVKRLANTRSEAPRNEREILVMSGEQLESALREAKDGDLFRLGAGEMSGVFIVNNVSVSLIGDMRYRTSLRNPNGKRQFVLLAKNNARVHIENVSFEFDGEKQIGVWAESSQVSMDRCEIAGATHHAVFGRDSTLELSGCRIANHQQLGGYAFGNSSISARGCDFEGGKRTALQCEPRADLHVERCKFTDYAAPAIQTQAARRVVIRTSEFRQCDRGISAAGETSHVAVLKCQFDGVAQPVALFNVGKSIVKNNRFTSLPEKARAILVRDGGSAIVADNSIQGGQVGIDCRGARLGELAVARNIVHAAEFGLYIDATAGELSKRPARVSRNRIAAAGGYGAVFNGQVTCALAANTMLSREGVSVSLQRGASAVMNRNEFCSRRVAVNFFEADPQKTWLIDEQVVGEVRPAMNKLRLSTASVRLHTVAKRSGDARSMRMLIDGVLNKSAQSSQEPFSKLREALDRKRDAAQSLRSVRVTISDSAGVERESEFVLFRGGAAVTGRYEIEDLIEWEPLFQTLSDPKSPLGSHSHFSNAKDAPGTDLNSTTIEQEVADELNRLAALKQLFDPDLFADVVPEEMKSVLRQTTETMAEADVVARNRRLIEAVYPQWIKNSQPIALSLDGPVFVQPGEYWVSSTQFPQLARRVDIDGGRVVLRNPNAIWAQVKLFNDQPGRWQLFGLRKRPMSQRFIGLLRRTHEWSVGVRGLEYWKRVDATSEQLNSALKLARKHLPVVLLNSEQAVLRDKRFEGREYLDCRMYTQRILAVAGDSTDAAIIASQLSEDKKTLTATRRWLAAIALIEARSNQLDTGELNRLAQGDRPLLAVEAAVRLHLCGIRKHDDLLRAFIATGDNASSVFEAAYAMLDDDSPSTLEVMATRHRRVLDLLANSAPRVYAYHTAPTTLYLLTYGSPSNLALIQDTPFTEEHLVHLAGVVSDPLQVARPLIEQRRFGRVREMMAAMRDRADSVALRRLLGNEIIRKMQSSRTNQLQQMWMAYRGAEENQLLASSYEPSAKAVQVLGFSDKTFSVLTPRADMLSTLQADLAWWANPNQLDTYVKNWQNGYETYRAKLDFFSLDEIQASIKRNGAQPPAALSLFAAAHAISSQRGLNTRDEVTDGVSRRAYIFMQPRDGDGSLGGVSGVLEFRWQTESGKTLLLLRNRQAPYYHGAGGLLGALDRPSDWQLHQYVKDGGRKLIERMELRIDGAPKELVERRVRPDGFREFELIGVDPLAQESLLHVSAKFFQQQAEFTFPLHFGESARRARIARNQ